MEIDIINEESLMSTLAAMPRKCTNVLNVIILFVYVFLSTERNEKSTIFCIISPVTHLNRDKIESNLRVPGIQGCHENALILSFELSPHLICLQASINIPLGPASGSGLDSG